MLAPNPPTGILPAAAYYDETWFELEQQRVIDATWHRGDDGPYFAEWEGMTFISERPTTSLREALGDLPNWIGSFRPSLLTEVARVDFAGDFNWKLFIENHVDVLHLWYLHSETLGGFNHAEFEHREVGANWASWEPARGGQAPMSSTLIAHLDERDRTGLGAHLLFPDTPMAAAASFFATYRARPVRADHTVIELRVLAEPGTDPAPLIEEISAFIEEDMAACEQIQRTVRSRHFEVGPLAVEHEAPVVRFQQHVLDLVGAPIEGEK